MMDNSSIAVSSVSSRIHRTIAKSRYAYALSGKKQPHFVMILIRIRIIAQSYCDLDPR